MKDSVRKILEADAEENGFIIIAWTDMGAIATPLAFSELYIALQQGTVDGLSKENQEALLEAGRQRLRKA